MRRDRLGVDASGPAAVAVGGDATGPIVTNSTFYLTSEIDQRASTVRPCLLPPEVSDFTGRGSEVDSIESEVLKGRESSQPATVVVSGKPGVGKTCLAVHVAHRLGASYADGELYADLRGVDEKPAAPEEIMARFMQALGVPEEEIPGDPHLRLDSYRRTISGRNLLVILDNAADEKQVRALLPTGSGSLAILTSRNKLAGLESVYRLDLETFPARTSLEFIKRVIGRDPLGREIDDTRSVAEFCGHLPLALRIAANRVNSARNMSMSDLAAELRDERDRLEALEVGDLAVRAAFSLSYRRLGKSCKNAFKSLAGVPGGDFGPGLCAALTGSGYKQSVKTLRKLAEANLVEPSDNSGRFRFHDLLKAFAREKLNKDSADRTQAARLRMLSWLQYSALRAQFFLGGVFEVEVPASSDTRIESVEDAARWVECELVNAVLALPISEAYDSPKNTTTFATALSAICETVGRWSEWEQVIDAGLNASQKIGEQDAEVIFLTGRANLARYRREFTKAHALAEELYATVKASKCHPIMVASSANLLGCLKMDLGLKGESLPFLRESLAICEKYNFKHEIGKTLYNLGTIHRASGEMKEAIDYFERDLAVCIDTADESGAAETLNTLALTHSEMGRLEKAERLQVQALEIFSRIGNPHKISMVTNDLAITLRRRGRYEEALALHLEDVEICSRAMNVSGEALAHSNAAEVLLRLGRFDEAAERSSVAQGMFAQLGDEQRLAKSLISHIPILFESGKIDEALKTAGRAIGVLERFGELKDIAATHQTLAREYMNVGEWGSALRHSMESLRVGGAVLTEYSRVISCGVALRAGEKLGSDEERTYCREVLLKAFESDPGVREHFLRYFGAEFRELIE
ncbi:ATP-binding protein [Streptomyces klenkii]|uniref:ATP-binding protein n=1 Tax=Streptomyces klenkii TaxID=1420899 RepID=UPI00343EF7CB